MEIKKFNVSKPKKYNDKYGNTKTQWQNVGTLTEFHKEDGTVNRLLDIPAIGLEANVFPFKDKEEQAQETVKMNGEDVSPDEIAF